MTQINVNKRAKNIGYFISCTFLVIHILLFILFKKYNVTPMIYFNIGSIIFYLITFVMNRFGLVRTYLLGVYLEVILHMSFAVYYVGWEAGFQITLIGMSVIAFYSDYLIRSMKLRTIHGLFLSSLSMISYIANYIIDQRVPAEYPLPDSTNYFLQIVWGVITFTIVIGLMQLFIMQAFNQEKYLSNKAGFDELTGLANRYGIDEYLQGTVLKNPETHWVAMMDIDNFKSINDTYGHNYGDYVLKTVGAIMREVLADEVLCRWGGEELLAIGTIKENVGIFERVDNFRKVVEDYDFFFNNTHVKLTISGGVAIYEKGQTITEWIDSADDKLYIAKKTGKNKVVVD